MLSAMGNEDFVICDDLMKILNHKSHCLALVSDAEVVTVALVAAKYFHNHHFTK